jgi:shikimate dehydrogenase
MNRDKYAVVGNPVSHSLSPVIHAQFAEQTEQDVDYSAIQIDIDEFGPHIKRLQAEGFKGVNVTVPFKREAWEMADKLSPRAQDAGAVNTLIFQPDGLIIGDNTDGMGLGRDLIVNHQVLIEHRKILILGAGGAVRGVLGPLLSKKPGLLTIANRTLEKAQQLAEDFFHLWDISPCTYEDLGRQQYNLIINGTSAGLKGEVPAVPDGVLGPNSICYDMMYDINKPTAFVKWARDRGAVRAHDGLGMLVEQAAESFYIWRGVRPQTLPVMQKLRPSI